MSLRLSSLDPNEPRAGKDCRSCNRRRIKCDRSLPTCKKCALKDLQCPGYGLRIQWGQGVASRGKLTGKTLPVLDANSTGSVDYNDSPKSSTPPESLGSRDENLESSPVPVPPGLRRAFEAAANGQSLLGGSANLDGDLTPDQIPLYVQDPIVQQLLHHYDKEVAAVMPWVDGPRNTWRTVIIPLGMESPSLLLAILALAAEHYTSKMGSTWSKQHGVSSSHYRDKSLKLLAQNLRCEMSEGASTPHQEPPSAMLATILILCNLEMIRSDSSVWSVHWKAARTITRRWTSPHHHHSASSTLDSICQLLIKEAFSYDVFASSTTFDNDDQIPSSVLCEDDEAAFTEWMRIIQEVTTSERYRYKLRSKGGANDRPPTPPMDIATLQRGFEYARQRSLHFEKAMDFGSSELHRDFGILISIFHFAGLLYSFRALLDTTGVRMHTTMQQLVQSTIHHINQIEVRSAFQHDFVWPLFIVGTESRDSIELQDFVESRLLEAMSSTGFSNCYPALQFLQRFWGTQPETTPDWLQFARQESARGFTFLVI
ncbi:uncharacterized protein A1O9_03901 [Exophiala aquamarina CBS 119918]|uniref:Zn(2)-C6 fungal-type domain-containing protein n=1 Tax=Exophiala aquamarina CBS 119918 TaxID=1182545 RepID=A0A072PIA9_9EURO|nr:uncharacterized protein A1O9_03901 [Exophiala aquamarina CBS 119918]KEF59058.1 hypothetical protein A1O9_03901 [Exophiala aquamarina CBS 119918]